MFDYSLLGDEKIMPIEEILHEDEFTGRVVELRELEHWVSEIGRVGAGSTSIIAPRRMGKTVLLDRLVNIVFFKPEYRVATFYIKFKREETTLRKFLLVYATEFFRQYIAYCLQDVILYQKTSMKVEKLLEIVSDNRAILLAQEHIKQFLERYNTSDHEDSRNHWDEFIKVPEKVAAHSGIRVAIIIDEFQDMKFYVYDTNDEGLAKWKDKLQGKPSYAAVDLTATFDRASLSKKAPMLVSGSAVTLIFRTVMGGPLGGRFGFKYLKPLSIDDGANLIINLVKIYTPTLNITPENAIYASTQVTGHPYYLYCLVTSDYGDKGFLNTDDIDKVIDYEINNGKIYGFWQTHFDENKEYINNDNNKEIGKKIIYFFTKYSDKEVDIDEIAKETNISKEEVEEKIGKLYLADLVYKTSGDYYGFNDICLMRYINHIYKKDLKNIKEIDLKERGKFNFYKGKFLELVVYQIMSRFNNETIEAKYFGKDKEVIAERLTGVTERYAKGETTSLYQIDVFGRTYNQQGAWLCECKNRSSKMGIAEIKKLEEAKDAFLMQERQVKEPQDVPKVKLWYISTGGFTEEAIRYLKEIEDVYYSDHEGINYIYKKYGGGFDVPVFE